MIERTQSGPRRPPKSTFGSGLSLALLALLAVTATGCVRVKPWQRATLARRCMLASPSPHEARIEQHLFAYREGSAGGYGDSGGGCGCN